MKKYIQPKASSTDLMAEASLMTLSNPPVNIYDEEANGDAPMSMHKGYSCEDWSSDEE